tara:strand:+ start:301 stop:1029 length:729 start_codon:yes stop_codon:yes gene_type:complete
MTLLSISNAVADETHGPRPVSIIDNTNPEAQNILRLINKVGQHLTKIYPWSILRKEHTFTAPGVETLLAAAAMPSDFDRFVPETFWDRDSNNLLSGPVGPVEWAGLKVQTFSSQNKKFTWRGGAVLTQPVFASGVNMAFEYIKKNWCDIAAGSGEKAAMTVDTDVTLIDEELVILGTIYEWLLAEGQPWQGAAKSYKDYFDTLTDNEIADGGIAVTGDIFAQNTRHFTGDPKASRASYGGDF